MRSYFSVKYYAISCLSILLIFITGSSVLAQSDDDLVLQLEINESLSNSQSINLSDILANRGQGPNLFTFFLRNNNDTEAAEDLYLNIILRSDRNGKIAEVYQRQGEPFSLDAGQEVRATNNTMQNGLPGIAEQINFDGGLTSGGEEFINDLRGSTRLPPGRYLIDIEVFQRSNGPNGGILVASDQAEIGANIVEEVRDIYLTSPGAELGANMSITNPYPEFRWEGSPGIQYRLIVVEAKEEEGAESLLQSALSTEPILENGVGGSGTLLDFEIADVRLQSTGFQMPPSGVQSLEGGNLYYWQVFAEIQTSNELQTKSSEIWSFVLESTGVESEQLNISPDGELAQLLRSLLGENEFRRLMDGEFELEAIEMDGEIISGSVMIERLREFLSRAENGEISTIDDD